MHVDSETITCYKCQKGGDHVKIKRSLAKPRAKTLRAAEKELHSSHSPKAARRTGGYVVHNAKGLKSKKK